MFEIPDLAYVASPEAQVKSVTAPRVSSRWQVVVTGYATGDYVLEGGFASKGTRVETIVGSTFAGQTETYAANDPLYVQYLPVFQGTR